MRNKYEIKNVEKLSIEDLREIEEKLKEEYKDVDKVAIKRHERAAKIDSTKVLTLSYVVIRSIAMLVAGRVPKEDIGLVLGIEGAVVSTAVLLSVTRNNVIEIIKYNKQRKIDNSLDIINHEIKNRNNEKVLKRKLA